MKKEVKGNDSNFSKYLSYLLRHNPGSIGLEMFDGGWVNTAELIDKINNSDESDYAVTFEALKYIVDKDNKGRYAFSEDFKQIKANHGHSIKDVKLDYKKANYDEVPEYLYHGTSEQNLRLIEESGVIKSMSRRYVHLSKDYDTAINVGSRHGKPVVLAIKKSDLVNNGNSIFLSEDGVYLTETIPYKLFSKVEK